MTLDDLKKIATGSVLFSLDRVIVPRLIRLVYLLGLLGIGLWGLDHLFDTFRFGFGNGIWGLLEVAVFGLLAFVALRVVCEMVMIFYKAHEPIHSTAMEPPRSASLIDDVAGAIEDLASEEDRAPTKLSASRSGRAKPAKTAAASAKSGNKPAAAKAAPAKPRMSARRTARRTPRPKSTS